ncbi:MAG TPA: GNAT family N-acetyltransferase [Propionibacteriaceae bacterium]|nr:GNAT family N-acetyltransferase [Propionibacteriaceae bacterium]
MDIELTFRDLQPIDLDELGWTGSETHLAYVRDLLEVMWAGDVDLVVGELRSGQLIAFGGSNYRITPDAGELWMLSVHPAWQSLGIGRKLIDALEAKVSERGLPRVQLSVEHDNPRAASLYRRLGYGVVGSGVEHWGIDGGQTYVTVVSKMSKDLRP